MVGLTDSALGFPAPDVMLNPRHRSAWGPVLLVLLAASCGEDPTGLESGSVGPDGGTLSFAGGQVILEVPAAAVAQQTAITVEPADAPPASSLLLPSTAYDLGPEGLQFSVPVTLHVAYEVDQLPTGVTESELLLMAAAGGAWERIDQSQLDQEAKRARGPISGSGTYAVHGANVASVDLRPRGAALAIGDTLRFTATPRDSDRRALGSRPVSWSSSDSAVAPVDSTGQVIGLAVGSAIISVRSADVETQVDVDVQVSMGAALGFLGYSNLQAKLTVCGTCHEERQATWELTGHARAWEVLRNSNDPNKALCYEGCHRISGRGNTLGPGAVTTGRRYEDVQCESCHGPGRRHMDDPTTVLPLASIAVGSNLTAGCGECHTGIDQPYLELWERSGHANVPHQAEVLATGDPTCLQCHEGKAAIRDLFGKISNYREIDDGLPQPIVCAVCHNPMGSPNENNARAPLDDEANHLCLQCHSHEAIPPSPKGPHGAQAKLLLGENVGWIPPGYDSTFDNLKSENGTSHRWRNPRLCITCHMPKFTVTDPVSGERLFEAVGHSFEAIVCLDAQGIPTPGPCDIQERYFSACSASGCHGTGEFARDFDFTPNRIRLNSQVDQLWDDIDGDGVIDATDGGLLPQVVALGDTSQLDVRDSVVTVPEGALWNAQVAHTDDRPQWADGEVFGIRFSASPTSGNGVHNPIFLNTLLNVTIEVLQAYLDARN